MTNTKTCAALVLLTALLGACSSTPIAQAPVAMAAPPATPAPAAPTRMADLPRATPGPAAASQVATVTLPAYLDPRSEISSGRSVYFDFDATMLKPEFSNLIERHGKYLAANPKLDIRIEGNTDERGSAEYNLALGQKRAESVRQALKVYGVKEMQMEAVSWGEEKPKAKGHDESEWAQNRRADLQYPAK